MSPSRQLRRAMAKSTKALLGEIEVPVRINPATGEEVVDIRILADRLGIPVGEIKAWMDENGHRGYRPDEPEPVQ